MCGRYSLTHSAEAIAARFSVTVPEWFEPRVNIAPTEHLPVVRSATGEAAQRRDIVQMRWGLVPFWADDLKIGARMINARAETVAKKSAFRAAFRRRRCLVPTDGFYEWVQKDGQKWPIHIALDEDRLGAFAGLWEKWSDDDGRVVESYTILTRPAAPVLEKLHDRMPLWAPEDLWDDWLTDDEGAESVLELMLDGFDERGVVYWPVSRELNRPGRDALEWLEPLDDYDLPRRM